MTLLRRAAGEKVALDLVLTGRLLAAQEALAAGLVARVVPDADLEREAGALLAALAAASPSALALTKQLFYQLDGMSLGRRRRAGRPRQCGRPPDARFPRGDRPVSPAVSWSALRIGLALAGFAVALLAIALEDHRVGWGAIALLVGSLIVRLLQRRDPPV